MIVFQTLQQMKPKGKLSMPKNEREKQAIHAKLTLWTRCQRRRMQNNHCNRIVFAEKNTFNKSHSIQKDQLNAVPVKYYMKDRDNLFHKIFASQDRILMFDSGEGRSALLISSPFLFFDKTFKSCIKQFLGRNYKLLKFRVETNDIHVTKQNSSEQEKQVWTLVVKLLSSEWVGRKTYDKLFCRLVPHRESSYL